MSDQKIYDGTLYDYTGSTYCGVLVAKDVMRKIAKEQARHTEAIKRILIDNKDCVFPSMWTLFYPDGKQEIVRFIDTSRRAEDAIKMARPKSEPAPCFPVFIAGSMDEARRLAEDRHETINS